MAFEKRDMSGALFHRDDAQGNQPGWTGYLVVDGTEYDLAAWLKASQSGTEFYSLKCQLPRPQDARQERPQAQPAQDEPSGMDSEIPF